VVILVVLACVLRATTKKVVNFFREKSAPGENPGYAYMSHLTTLRGQKNIEKSTSLLPIDSFFNEAKD